jgi:hypothetical protein
VCGGWWVCSSYDETPGEERISLICAGEREKRKKRRKL